MPASAPLSSSAFRAIQRTLFDYGYDVIRRQRAAPPRTPPLTRSATPAVPGRQRSVLDYVRSGSHPVRGPERSHPLPQRFVAVTITFWCANKDKDGNERPYRLDRDLADSNLRESDTVDVQIPAELAEEGLHLIKSPLSSRIHQFALDHHLDVFTNHYQNNLEYNSICYVLRHGSSTPTFLGPDEASSYDPMSALLRDAARAFAGGAYSPADPGRAMAAIFKRHKDYVPPVQTPPVNNSVNESCVFDVLREFHAIHSDTTKKMEEAPTIFRLGANTSGPSTIELLQEHCGKKGLGVRVFDAATGELIAGCHPSQYGKAKTQKYPRSVLNAMVAFGHLQLCDDDLRHVISHTWPWDEQKQAYVRSKDNCPALSIDPNYPLPVRRSSRTGRPLITASSVAEMHAHLNFPTRVMPEFFKKLNRPKEECGPQNMSIPNFTYFRKDECTDMRNLVGELVITHRVLLSSLSEDRQSLSFRLGRTKNGEDLSKSKHMYVSVTSMIRSEGEPKIDLADVEAAVAFKERTAELDLAGLTNIGISHYSDSLSHAMDAFPVKEMTGCKDDPFGGVPEDDWPDWEHWSGDGFREYTSDFLSHQEMPKFSVFDEFLPYEPEGELADASLYLVRATSEARDEYLHEGVRLVNGRNLREYVRAVNQVPFQIVSVCHPKMTVETGSVRAMVAAIEEDNRLTEQGHKTIPNRLWGKLGRTDKKNSDCQVFTDEQEARHRFEELGGRRDLVKMEGAWMYTDQDKTHRVHIGTLRTQAGLLYVVTEKKQRKYQSGFRPWNHIIKDTAHLQLAKRSKLFRELGFLVTGYKTDEIWLAAPRGMQAEFPPSTFSSPAAGFFKNLGKVKPLSRMNVVKVQLAGLLAPDRFDSPAAIELALAGAAMHLQPRARMAVKTFSEEEEDGKGKHVRTLVSYINVQLRIHKRFLILADLPGSGKTHLSKKFITYNPSIKKAADAETTGIRFPTALFVCPSKKQAEELTRDGWRADTVCKFFGHMVDNTKVSAYSDAAIRQLQIVVFEEIYMYNTEMRQSVYRFMRRYPDIWVLANGDPLQLHPIETHMKLSKAEQKRFRQANIEAMFPEALCLQTNKSMKSAEDRHWLAVIKQMLFPTDGRRPLMPLEINGVLKALGFAGFDEYSSLESCPTEHPLGLKHLGYMNNTVSKITHLVMRKQGRRSTLPVPGDEVSCIRYLAKTGNRQAVTNQSEWIVQSQEVGETSGSEYWVLASAHEESKTISIGAQTFSRHFAHSIGCTSYKFQGGRTDDYVVCHDMQYTQFADAEYFWMCLTRVRSLKNFALCILPATHLFQADYRMMATSTKAMAASDKAAGRDAVPVASLAHMKAVMKEQRWRCAGCCGRMLDCVEGTGERRWVADRIDCHLGHIDGNIQFLCAEECNTSKSSYERFV